MVACVSRLPQLPSGMYSHARTQSLLHTATYMHSEPATLWCLHTSEGGPIGRPISLSCHRCCAIACGIHFHCLCTSSAIWHVALRSRQTLCTTKSTTVLCVPDGGLPPVRIIKCLRQASFRLYIICLPINTAVVVRAATHTCTEYCVLPVWQLPC